MIFQEIQRGPELIFGETPRQHEEGTLVALESCALRTERGLHHQVSKCLRAQGASATPPRLDREARRTRKQALQQRQK